MNKILRFPKSPQNRLELGQSPGSITFYYHGPKKSWYQRVLIKLLGFKYEYNEKGFNYESSN